MSDYLWDKTGETDPEVEQLEELLGSFKFQPKPLVLPETITSHARPRRPTYLQGLAIAASLLLVSLVGWWFVARRHDAVSQPASVAQTPNKINAPTATGTELKDVATTTNGSKEESRQGDEKALQQTLAAAPRRRTVQRATFEKRRMRPEKDFSPATSQQDETASATPALSPEEMEEAERGKEQLMLALQVASAKLNHAHRKAQTVPGVDKGSKPEQKPDNQLR